MKRYNWFALCFLILLGLVVYGRCVTFDYTHYDDAGIVFENPLILSGLSLENVWYVFTNRFENLYQPLPVITLMIDRSLWGDRIAGFFISNLLWHLLCVCTFYLIMMRFFNCFPMVFAASLIFCVHPVQAMVIHSAHLRNETMPAFFMLLSLEMYRRYCAGKSEQGSKPFVLDCEHETRCPKTHPTSNYTPEYGGFAMHKRAHINRLLSLLFMFLCLLCKQGIVMLPVILLLLDYWPLGRIEFVFRRPLLSLRKMLFLILEKLPWFALSGIGVVLAFFGKTNLIQQFGEDFSSHLSTSSFVVTAYVRYIWHLVYPLHHRYIWVLDWDPSRGVVILSALFLFFSTAICFLNIKRRPWLMFGWGWFIFFLLPFSGLLTRFSAEHISLRYLYVPGMGLYLMLAFGMHEITFNLRQYLIGCKVDDLEERGDVHKNVIGFSADTFYLIGVAVLTFILAFASFWQSGFWRNTETLTTRAYELTNGKDWGTTILLEMLYSKDVNPDLTYEPLFPEVENLSELNNWRERYVFFLIQHKRYEQALKHITPLIITNPSSSLLWSAYAGALLGTALNQVNSAQKSFEHANEMSPRDAYTHYNLALTFILQDRTEQAMSSIKRAVELCPNNIKIRALAELIEKRKPMAP